MEGKNTFGYAELLLGKPGSFTPPPPAPLTPEQQRIIEEAKVHEARQKAWESSLTETEAVLDKLSPQWTAAKLRAAIMLMQLEADRIGRLHAFIAEDVGRFIIRACDGGAFDGGRYREIRLCLAGEQNASAAYRKLMGCLGVRRQRTGRGLSFAEQCVEAEANARATIAEIAEKLRSLPPVARKKRNGFQEPDLFVWGLNSVKITANQRRLLQAVWQQGNAPVEDVVERVWGHTPSDNAIKQVVKRINDKLSKVGYPKSMSYHKRTGQVCLD